MYLSLKFLVYKRRDLGSMAENPSNFNIPRFSKTHRAGIKRRQSLIKWQGKRRSVSPELRKEASGRAPCTQMDWNEAFSAAVFETRTRRSRA